ncbi:MAG: hypothetical protein M3R05_05730 [Chloroflexota bacterium]|nr:hypothetical protein [Chloroflexota bacterium]
MDQATRFLLVTALAPALIGAIVAWWAVWANRRQRERDADRRDLLEAIDQTKRDAAARIRYLVRTAARERVEDLESLLPHDAYPRSDLALIGDAKALHTYLNFEARVLAYARAGQRFADGDLLGSGRMVGRAVSTALDAQYRRARAGKRVKRLTAEQRRMIEPDELGLRQSDLDQEVIAWMDARQYAAAERGAGRSAMATDAPSASAPPEYRPRGT